MGIGFPGAAAGRGQVAAGLHVTSFGFDPGNTCGDGPDAATRTFKIYTKKAGAAWVLAYSGGRLTTGRLNKLIPTAGASNVRFVKLVLLTNRGNPSYMDMSELTVRGS